MGYTAKYSSHQHPTKKLVWILCGIAAVILLVAALEFTNVTHVFHAKKAVSGPIPTKAIRKPAPPSTNTDDNQSTATPSEEPTTPKPAPPSGSGGSTNTSGATLIAPSGTFVSNHRPGQNSTPLDEQSTCITTPGATCTIIFKTGTIQRTLEARTADSSGTVTWDWNIHESGLTKGSWTITASASLNGQTKTTNDQNPLEVQ